MLSGARACVCVTYAGQPEGPQRLGQGEAAGEARQEAAAAGLRGPQGGLPEQIIGLLICSTRCNDLISHTDATLLCDIILFISI